MSDVKKIVFISLMNVIFQLYGQITPGYTSRLSPYDAYSVSGEDTVLGIFLKDDQLSREDLKNLGVNVSTVINGMMTGQVSIKDYRYLMKNKLVAWASIAGRLYPTLDVSGPAVNMATGEAAAGGTKGSGVVIGFWDTGIDVNHADFKDSNNNTRIKRLWDQTGSGNPPDQVLFDYGYEWTESDINNGTCTAIDYNGHGTSVAGVAVGNGNATGNNQPPNTYVGMASEADIIFVNANFGGNTRSWENYCVDGCNYIVQKAVNDLNEPWVINLSVGTNRGPHNGTSPFEELIDGLIESNFGSGNVIAVAAGNEGDKAYHSQKTGITDTHYVINATAYNNTEQDWFRLEVFYPSAQTYSLQITPPDPYTSARIWNTNNNEWSSIQLQSQLFQPNHGTGGWSNDPTLISYYLTEAGGVAIHNEDFPEGRDPYPDTDDLSLIIIDIFDNQSPAPGPEVDLKNGSWKLKMWGGTGRWDVYSLEVVNENVGFASGDYTSAGTIREPNCAQHVISVGSMNSRNVWPGIQPVPGFPVGSITSFSSLGPTRDGRSKPDIYAPGAFIGTSKSVYVTPDPLFLLPDGVHHIVAGTSLAAPHVAGAAAVLLQLHPTWTSQQIKDWLATTADQTNGFPLLDIWSALCTDNDNCSMYPAGFVAENASENSIKSKGILPNHPIMRLIILTIIIGVVVFYFNYYRKGGHNVA